MTEQDKPVKAILAWELNGRHELLLHEGDTAEVGRVDGNDLILPDDHISRKHAIIAWRGGHFEIQDLGSVNGTFVNEKPVAKPRVLKNGDKIAFHEIEVSFTEHTKPVQEVENKSGAVRTIVMRQGTQPTLVISAGPGEGRKIILRQGKMTIGRATAHSDNWEIALQDRSVSRPHASIEGSSETFTLTDLGSANGTLVNGQTLEAPATLKDGDVILIGETTLIYRAA